MRLIAFAALAALALVANAQTPAGGCPTVTIEWFDVSTIPETYIGESEWLETPKPGDEVTLDCAPLPLGGAYDVSKLHFLDSCGDLVKVKVGLVPVP